MSILILTSIFTQTYTSTAETDSMREGSVLRNLTFYKYHSMYLGCETANIHLYSRLEIRKKNYSEPTQSVFLSILIKKSSYQTNFF